MGAITLTDRISVRVTAKNDTESSNQNKRDGGNVASTLGATGLTDSEKEEIGEGLGETVTGEDGKTYAKIGNVATMYSKLYQDEKLSGPTEIHEGLDDGQGGIVSMPSGVVSGPVTALISNEESGYRRVLNIPDVYYLTYQNSDWYSVYMFSKANFSYSIDNIYTNGTSNTNNYTGSATSTTINGVRYSFFNSAISVGLTGDYDVPMTGGSQPTDDQMASYLFGPTHTSGGSRIDPTGKTNDQIKKEIEDAAEASNAKQTYMDHGVPTDYCAVTDANGDPIDFLAMLGL